MDDDNKEQCINYMYAAKKLVGLLVNFRCSSIQKERFVNFDLLNKEIWEICSACREKCYRTPG